MMPGREVAFGSVYWNRWRCVQRKYFQLLHSGCVQRNRNVYRFFISGKPGAVVSQLETEINCKNLKLAHRLGRKIYVNFILKCNIFIVRGTSTFRMVHSNRVYRKDNDMCRCIYSYSHIICDLNIKYNAYQFCVLLKLICLTSDKILRLVCLESMAVMNIQGQEFTVFAKAFYFCMNGNIQEVRVKKRQTINHNTLAHHLLSKWE